MALPCIVGRMGGKSKLKKIIVEKYFPDDYESMLYVEPFVGGGSIFFHKNPSVLEIVNDLDISIYSIFKGAKTYTHLNIAKKLDGVYTKDDFNDIKNSNTDNDFDKFCKHYFLITRSIMSLGSVFKQFRPKMKVKLEGFKERLEDVIIYNTDYKELIAKYDSNETFFYLDPPYEKSIGCYKHHIIDMNEMYNLLSNIKGKFLMSYNNSEVVRELFKDFNIYEVETTYLGGIVNRGIRQTKELLISNYPCV